MALGAAVVVLAQMLGLGRKQSAGPSLKVRPRIAIATAWSELWLSIPLALPTRKRMMPPPLLPPLLPVRIAVPAEEVPALAEVVLVYILATVPNHRSTTTITTIRIITTGERMRSTHRTRHSWPLVVTYSYSTGINRPTPVLVLTSPCAHTQKITRQNKT